MICSATILYEVVLSHLSDNFTFSPDFNLIDQNHSMSIFFLFRLIHQKMTMLYFFIFSIMQKFTSRSRFSSFILFYFILISSVSFYFYFYYCFCCISGLCVFVYIVAALAMLVPVFIFEFWWVFSAFLVLEASVGMFNSCGATLRSRYYPEGLQSSIMSVFRLPLNLLVVIGTKLTDKADDIPSLQMVFGTLACMHFVAMILQITLQVFKSKEDVKMVETAAVSIDKSEIMRVLGSPNLKKKQ